MKLQDKVAIVTWSRAELDGFLAADDLEWFDEHRFPGRSARPPRQRRPRRHHLSLLGGTGLTRTARS